MESEAKDEVVAAIRRCVKTGKPHHFWLFEKDVDELPHFLVERKEAAVKKTARAVRKTAKVKLSANGPLRADDDGLIFVNEGTLPSKRVLKVLKKLAKEPEFKKIGVYLKTARIYTPEEYELSIGGEASESSDFDDLLSLAQGAVSGLKAAFKGTEGADAVGDLASAVKAAASEHEAGRTEAATEALQRVLERADAMAEKAWKEVAGPIRDRYQQTRTELQGSVDATTFDEAFAPFQALQERAISQKKAKRWARSVQTLRSLADALDDVDVDGLMDRSEEDPDEGDASAPTPPVDEDSDSDPGVEGEDDAEGISEEASDAIEALDLAEDAFLRHGEPAAASKALDALRAAVGRADWAGVPNAAKAFHAALEGALEAHVAPALKALAKLRLGMADDLKVVERELDKYIETVRADEEVPAPIFQELEAPFVQAVKGLLPTFRDELLGAVDDAINAEGSARRDHAIRVSELIASSIIEVRMSQASLPVPLESSAFGTFAVHAHVLTTLERIGAAAAALTR